MNNAFQFNCVTRQETICCTVPTAACYNTLRGSECTIGIHNALEYMQSTSI